MQGPKPFPVHEETIEARSSIFNAAPAFSNYLNFLKKACFLNGDNVDWLTPAVINIARGLKLPGVGEIRFPNFINSAVAHKIIKREGAISEFARLAYVSYHCALRAPSESFPLRRAFSGDGVFEFTEQREHGIIGVRYIRDAHFLPMRFKKRKIADQARSFVSPVSAL